MTALPNNFISASENTLTSEQLLEQGLGFHQEGHLDKAIEVYQRLLTQAPEHADALHLMGEALYRKRHYAQALSYVNSAIAHTPHHFYLNTRANILLELGHLKEAEQDLRRAIKVEPNYLEAHINLSNVYRKQDDFKKAKRYSDLAIKINPDSAAAWNALGAVQMESGQLNLALASFDQALDLAPEALIILKNKAKILAAQKKWEEGDRH